MDLREEKPVGRHKQPLVAQTAVRLRELVMDCEPETFLGSLNEVASNLGVGIVTVQQTARILEHEGLLRVKRGPGGGYYGTRPDDEALERSLATYMSVQRISYREAFELSVILDSEIIFNAAQSFNSDHTAVIESLISQLQNCESAEAVIQFEIEFRTTLLSICYKPLLELLAKVAMQLYSNESNNDMLEKGFPLDHWRTARLRILQAILAHDKALAKFEAERFREMILEWTNSETAFAPK